MRDLVDGLMSAVLWLWSPVFFPVGAIVVSTLAAVVAYRGAARAGRLPVTPPLVVQPWAWVGGGALALCLLLVAGVAVLAPWGVMIFAAWLSLPSALIGTSLLGARPGAR